MTKLTQTSLKQKLELMKQQDELRKLNPPNPWININDQKPIDGQDVWYYFGVFDRMYQGTYYINEESYTDDDGVEHTFQKDCFCNNGGGFLNDDVTWWSVRDDKPAPLHPTPLQLLQDRHVPDYLQVKLDATTIDRIIETVDKHHVPELSEQIQQILNNPRLPDYFYTEQQDN